MRRDAVGDVGDHLVLGEVGAGGLPHDERLRHLLALVLTAAAHADDRGVGDLVVGQQQRLQLGRRHLVALVLDQLLDPVDDVEDAVLVDGRDVAGVQVAVGVERRGGRLGVVEVAGHDVRALAPQLAAPAGADLIARLRVDELALHVRHGHADAADIDVGVRSSGMAWLTGLISVMP